MPHNKIYPEEIFRLKEPIDDRCLYLLFLIHRGVVNEIHILVADICCHNHNDIEDNRFCNPFFW
jgi:hypothetical protein